MTRPPMSPREQALGLTAAALMGLGIVAILADFHPAAATGIVTLAYCVDAMILARSLRR